MARNCFILAFVALSCIFVLCTAVDQAKKPGWQMDIVKQLYNNTALGRKYIKQNYLYNSDMCSWMDISCDLNMHISRFRAAPAYFNWTIPEAIGKLNSLEDLNIVGYNLEREAIIPSFIGNLTNLTHLTLGKFLVGTIPQSYANLKNLEEIDLHGNRLTGTIPSGLDPINLPKLRRINLSENRLTGQIPDELMRISFVRSEHDKNFDVGSVLDLSNNQLTGSVPHVIYESGVDEIFLYNNQLTIFDENIPEPPKLMGCIMENNPFICPIPQWAKDRCAAKCTSADTMTSITSLSNSTIAIIIASACASAIVILTLALFFSRRFAIRRNTIE